MIYLHPRLSGYISGSERRIWNYHDCDVPHTDCMYGFTIMVQTFDKNLR